MWGKLYVLHTFIECELGNMESKRHFNEVNTPSHVLLQKSSCLADVDFLGVKLLKTPACTVLPKSS